MLLVPSREIWGREEFLQARRRQIEAHANGEIDCLCNDPIFKGAEEIVMDPGDDIICDSCNAEVMTQQIHLVQWGRRVVCDECFARWYADEPIEYRTLRSDGTLGEIVPKMR